MSMDIAACRLHQLLVSRKPFTQPVQVVKHLGAMQAQDYLASLWAIGLRVSGERPITEATVEKAASDRQIVRTWPMRGTLHWVAAEDVHWMLELLTPRIIRLSAGRHRELDLDQSTFKQSRSCVEATLAGGKQLTRQEMYNELQEAGISTEGQRGYHILVYLAQTGVICWGPRRGKQHTFTLLEEWIGKGQPLQREEALAKLARRYFTSHGPATVYDFSYWSGLTVTESRKALKIIRTDLEEIPAEDQNYWFIPESEPSGERVEQPGLLPAFDEILCGYKDRSALLDKEDHRDVILRNGIFMPSILLDGKIRGIWKRTLAANEVRMQLNTFDSLNDKQQKALTEAAHNYGAFLDLPVSIEH